MDLELVQGILGALPALGPLGGMTVMVVILLRWQGQTSARHGEELDRMARLHDADTAELRTENGRLREQRDAAEEQVRRVCALQASDNPLARATRVPPERPDSGPVSSPGPGSSRSGRRHRAP